MTNNFITNSKEQISLRERLKSLISESYELKFLVGFFYFSGWQEIYQSLEKNESVKIKILVGLQTDRLLSQIVEIGNQDESLSSEEYFSHFMKSLGIAINNNEMDNEKFYTQLNFFIELLECDRLIIRKTLNPNHAKIYLFKLQPNIFNLDGEFITGSSNFTKSGLSKQEEFNVEIRDYGFETAEKYFDELWETSIPISENPNWKNSIIDFLKNRTQASLIEPFESYAFILKTYLELHEAKKINKSVEELLEENGFEKYSYQLDAVNQALTILETHNGVIIADVVGLGKSVIASLLAKQIGKRGLILCPPGLIGNQVEGSGWWEYLNKFKLHDWDIKSSGNLEALSEAIQEKDFGYELIVVDEAHKFRNQDTSAYEALANICRGKKVILLTATPFNNSPADIFSLLKLFIVPGASGITLESDLEGRFNSYNYRFKNLSFILKNYNSHDSEKRKKAERVYEKMFGLKPPIDTKLVKENVGLMSKDIKNVISPVIIRRNRLDLKKDFEYKNEVQNISEIKDPKEIYFELDKKQSEFYDQIINDYFGETGLFKGAIYQPSTYEKKNKTTKDENENRTFQQQKNLYDFMRRLIVKRFESSFGAFEKSISRFLKVHKMVKSFIETSGKYILDRKAIESIYNEEDDVEDFTIEAIYKSLEDFKERAKDKTSPKHTKIYEIDKFVFKKEFLADIENDIAMFELINDAIINLDLVRNDPKRVATFSLMERILSQNINPKRKIILFSEYTDTVRHLQTFFKDKFDKRVLFCDGNISKTFVEQLNSNFNAKSEHKRNDFDILITSDKLSEGFNLNQAGLIINYDIPWNPTRVIQRVGRINRIGAKVFEKLFIYNIFPTEKGAGIVKSKEIASQKMFLIHNALGEDSKIFEPEEEPSESGLFKKLNSFSEGEEQEINLTTILRNEFNDIKNKFPEVIERINNLPNRTKTAKSFQKNNTVVLRKKGVALFALILSHSDKSARISEISIEELIKNVKCDYDENRLQLSKQFWKDYNLMKEFSPKYKSSSSNLSFSQKATNSLKSLLKAKRQELSQSLISFIDTLLIDIKKYKTLSDFSLRRLILKENIEDPIGELTTNILDLQKRVGNNYLNEVLEKTSRLEENVIISVENKFVNKNSN